MLMRDTEFLVDKMQQDMISNLQKQINEYMILVDQIRLVLHECSAHQPGNDSECNRIRVMCDDILRGRR